jgi:shikimate kinase
MWHGVLVMNNTQSIVLTGFMGTGKSTVSHYVAKILKRRVLDTDQMIEERTRLSISRIFALRGEAYFRVIERGVCHELALRSHMVISTGGGALMNEDNRKAFLESSFVVCLFAEPSTIESRISKSQNRPLATQWKPLLEQRLATYQALPNAIHTDNKTPENIAKEIITLWTESQ